MEIVLGVEVLDDDDETITDAQDTAEIPRL